MLYVLVVGLVVGRGCDVGRSGDVDDESGDGVEGDGVGGVAFLFIMQRHS